MGILKLARKCVPDGILLRIAPCGGPLYEGTGNFVEYRCETHAKILMRMYPLGPTYRKVEVAFSR